MNENRRRNKTITVRVTEKEKEYIMERVKKSKLNLTTFVVYSCVGTPIVVREDMKPYLTELKRIGNNINQIATKINSGAFSSYNFEDVIEELEKIYDKISEIARNK